MSNLLACPAGHEWQNGDVGTAATFGRSLACPMCGAAPTLESLGAPPATAAALGRLRDDLKGMAGANMAGLILYGGLARGRYHPGKSDVNLVVLLRDASGPALAALAPLLRGAWRALQVEPLVLVPDEIPEAAIAFPTKFLDIKSHHLVLLGEDPFAELEVGNEPLRARISQSLRNLALRVRRRYLALAHDPIAVAQMLGEVARPLAIELAGLLRLSGRDVPCQDRTTAIFEAASSAFHLDGAALLQLAELRRDSKIVSDPTHLVTQVLATLSRAIDVVHHLREARP
jgi:hypothetical protein